MWVGVFVFVFVLKGGKSVGTRILMCAAEIARDAHKYPRSPHELQTTGKTGTVQYMAPEVMRSENYDETVDLYRF